MYTFEQFINELNEGYIFEFKYMEKIHKAMSFDKRSYVIKKFTNDNRSEREESSIIEEKVLKEMWKDISDITYSY